MQYTEYFNLAKPDSTDFVDVSVLNGNAEKIDTALHNAGGSEFVVTYTPTGEDTATCDKTYEEIVEAIEAGKFVRAIATLPEMFEYHLSLVGYMSDVGVMFNALITADVVHNNVTLLGINHTPSGEISLFSKSVPIEIE